MAEEKKKETAGEMIRSFLFAILIALVFRSVAYEPFHIPSGSMLSTLYEGDYIFVSKLSYGYSRFSFPFGFKFFEGRMFETLPEQGDAVVFRPPPKIHVDFIKRVIGLPGDKIQMMHGVLYINGKVVKSDRVNDIVTLNEGQIFINASPLVVTDKDHVTVQNGILMVNNEAVFTHTGEPTFSMKDGVVQVNGEAAHWTILASDPDDQYDAADRLMAARKNNGLYPFVRRFMETLPNGKKHVTLDAMNAGPADNTGIYTVPAGHYFMMGDNRDNSQDSRFAHQPGFLDVGPGEGVGYVPIENIIGRADMILLSYDTSVAFYKFWQWPAAFRSGRWFKKI